MVTKKTWAEFRKTGLLLIINQILHIFGWAIVLDIEDYGKEPGKISAAYPARVKFRGFAGKCVDRGYRDVQTYLEKNIKSLHDDFRE